MRRAGLIVTGLIALLSCASALGASPRRDLYFGNSPDEASHSHALNPGEQLFIPFQEVRFSSSAGTIRCEGSASRVSAIDETNDAVTDKFRLGEASGELYGEGFCTSTVPLDSVALLYLHPVNGSLGVLSVKGETVTIKPAKGKDVLGVYLPGIEKSCFYDISKLSGAPSLTSLNGFGIDAKSPTLKLEKKQSYAACPSIGDLELDGDASEFYKNFAGQTNYLFTENLPK
jgi:hypothetical protein